MPFVLPGERVKAIEIVKTRLGGYDSSGRRKPIATDEVQRFDCDPVIYAVGETVDLDCAKASGLALREGGTIEVNRFTLETSRPRFYAGGDLVTGASNVSNAMASGGAQHRFAGDGSRSLEFALSRHPIRTDATGRSEPEPASHWA